MKPTSVSVNKKSYNNSSTLRHSRLETRLTDDHSNTNIISERTSSNIELRDVNVRDAFQHVYGESVKRFNAGESNKKRHIGDMYDKLVSNKKTKPYVEFVFKYGSSTDMTPDGIYDHDSIDRDGPEWSRRVAALEHFGSNLDNLFPSCSFYYIGIHVDEDNPHIHAFGIPHFHDETKKLDVGFSFNKSMIECAELVGVELDETKTGDKSQSSMMTKYLQGFIRDAMVESYECVNDTKLTLSEKSKHSSLHIEEYKKAIKPINDLHKEMASSLATLQLVVKQLNELALSEKDKNNVLDIVNSIDVDGMLDRLNAASDVIGVGEVELSFDGLDVDQLKI